MRNNKGSALILVILIMMVLTILGTSFLFISVSENKFVQMQERKMKAYYVARSGADALAQYIILNPLRTEELVNMTDVASSDFATGDIEDIGSFEIDVVDQSNNNTIIKLASEGNVMGTVQAANVYLYMMTSSLVFDKAIYTNSDLDISNMKVTGDISSKGKITYKAGDSNNSYHGIAYPFTTRILPEPVFPNPTLVSNVPIKIEDGELSINDSSTYDEITVTKNGTMSINAYNKVVKVVIDKLTIDESLSINTPDNGRVELYINELITITNKGVINNSGYSSNLFIYLKKDSLLDMQAGKVLNGYIYGPYATVYVQSEWSVINGAVISNIVLKNTNNGPNGIVNYVPIPSDIDVSSTIKAYQIVHWD